MNQSRVASYKGYGIFDLGLGHLLISADDEDDYFPQPFCCIPAAKERIDQLTS